MARRKPRTWLEVAVVNAGFRQGATAITWAYCWAYTRRKLGREPTVEEIAEEWNMSRATAFREQACFRKAFPTLDSPAPMYDTPEAQAQLDKSADTLDEIVEEIGKRRRSRREAGAIAFGLLQAPTALQ